MSAGEEPPSDVVTLGDGPVNRGLEIGKRSARSLWQFAERVPTLSRSQGADPFDDALGEQLVDDPDSALAGGLFGDTPSESFAFVERGITVCHIFRLP
jgi:hypothetical protein